MLFSIETGFHNSVFEGDSTLVIKLLQDRMVSHPQGGHILKDIVSHLNSLQSLSLTHVGKQGNAVAHALTQRSRLSFPLRFGWSLFLQPFLLLYCLTFGSSFLLMNYLSSQKKKKKLSIIPNTTSLRKAHRDVLSSDLPFNL